MSEANLHSKMITNCNAVPRIHEVAGCFKRHYMRQSEKLTKEPQCCGETRSDDTIVLFHTHHAERSPRPWRRDVLVQTKLRTALSWTISGLSTAKYSWLWVGRPGKLSAANTRSFLLNYCSVLVTRDLEGISGMRVAWGGNLPGMGIRLSDYCLWKNFYRFHYSGGDHGSEWRLLMRPMCLGLVFFHWHPAPQNRY